MTLPVFDLPWWGYVLVSLAMVQITIACTTLYLHRGVTHRSVDYHPIASHFFRFWLWLTTGMVTKEWVAVHRKHHAKCEGPEDPHSPQQVGINRVLWGGVFLYRNETAKAETLERYGFGSPDDWLERKLYTPHNFTGVIFLALLYGTLFGWVGALMWAVHVVWIPFWAAGVINGVAHYWGYRNYDTPDSSTNIAPLAFFIGGEELHNNHHAFPTSARFSSRPGEFDIGWLYLKLLAFVRLSRIKYISPKPSYGDENRPVGVETLKNVQAARYHLMARYMRHLRQIMREDQTLPSEVSSFGNMRILRAWVAHGSQSTFPPKLRDHALSLQKKLASSAKVQNMLTMGRDMVELWQHSSLSRDQLVTKLTNWLHKAEDSGIHQMKELAKRVRACTI